MQVADVVALKSGTTYCKLGLALVNHIINLDRFSVGCLFKIKQDCSRLYGICIQGTHAFGQVLRNNWRCFVVLHGFAGPRPFNTVGEPTLTVDNEHYRKHEVTDSLCIWSDFPKCFYGNLQGTCSSQTTTGNVLKIWPPTSWWHRMTTTTTKMIINKTQ